MLKHGFGSTSVPLVSVGYLVSTTFHHKESRSFYRETVCQLSPSGQLLSILPCLGPGPRDFCPVLLPPQPNQEGEGEGSNPGCATWHVYMRDGHEGFIAVRLWHLAAFECRQGRLVQIGVQVLHLKKGGVWVVQPAVCILAWHGCSDVSLAWENKWNFVSHHLWNLNVTDM